MPVHNNMVPRTKIASEPMSLHLNIALVKFTMIVNPILVATTCTMHFEPRKYMQCCEVNTMLFKYSVTSLTGQKFARLDSVTKYHWFVYYHEPCNV